MCSNTHPPPRRSSNTSCAASRSATNPPPALRAAIYGPTHQIGRWQPTCTAWCTARRYDLVSVVDLLHAMADGDINIAMVATLAGLPADRMARVETIGRRQPVRRGSS